MKKKFIPLMAVLVLVTSCSLTSNSSIKPISTTLPTPNSTVVTSSTGDTPMSSSTNNSKPTSSTITSTIVTPSSSTTTYPEYAGFKLGWHDEFDGDTLGREWDYMIGNGSQYGNWGWGNNEQQYYTDQNTEVRDGNLVITARRETIGNYKFTSARLRTQNEVSTLYGRIEARISLPIGQGLWPAFWMLPESFDYGGWPTSGEIDIMENRGRQKDITSGALHFDLGTSATHQYISSTAVLRNSTINEYHIYALEWTKDEMKWYVDDNNFLTIESSKWHCSKDPQNPGAPFDKPFHLLLNMAVGGNFDGGIMPEDSFESAEMKVDYVRIYDLA